MAISLMAERYKRVFFPVFLGGLFVLALGFPAVGLAQSYGEGDYGADEYGAAANISPLVEVTAPSDGATMPVGASVHITASSSDPDGSVASVNFLIDGATIGTSSSPYTVDWTATMGSHTVAAVAMDNQGSTSTSTVTISVTVANPGGALGGSLSADTSASASEKPSTNEVRSTAAVLEILKALKSRLMALLADRGSVPAASPAGFAFKVDLKIGRESEDVRRLQRFLNSEGFVVSPVGPGSPGHESTYFGDLTREALAQFQYHHDIAPAVGFLGPITRALINARLQQ